MCFASSPTLCLLAQMMEDTHSDFTMTFRQLSELSAQQLRNKNFEQVELIRLNSFLEKMIERQWTNKDSYACLVLGLGSGRLVLP